MTHISWVNRSIFLATAGGTASFSVSAAVTGYMTPASAGTVDGEEYHYAAETTNGSGSINQWEVGTGVYTATSATFARTPLFSSTTANAVVNFATAPYVMLTALAEDFEVELDANTTLYVATTGSDVTGDGSVGNPWATLQYALDYLVSIELQGFTATIQIADGTYVGANMPRPSSSGIIAIKGNVADNTLVVIDPNAFGFNCFSITAPNLIQISDLTINPGGTSSHIGIYGSGDGITVFLNNVSFAGGGGVCIWGTNGPFFNITGTWAIAGNWVNAIELDSAQCEIDTSTITLTATPDFSGTFIKVTDQGLYHSFTSPPTFSGTATGKRFIVSDGGVIQTTTNDLTYFPGDVTGDILVGGQYDRYGMREVLVADRNYYIATTGNDSNDGSSGSPWLTLQHAMFFIAEGIDIAGFTVTVNIGAGTFAGFGTTGCVGGGVILFSGNGTGAGSTTIIGGPNDGTYNTGDVVDVFISPGNTAIALNNLIIDIPQSFYGVQIQNPPAVVYLGSPIYPYPTTLTVKFPVGGAGGFATYCAGGEIFTNNTLTPGDCVIDGGTVSNFYDCAFGQIFDNTDWTIINTPSWNSGTGFARCNDNGNIGFSSHSSITGAATGVRFVVKRGGSITGTASGALGPTYLPGDVDGIGDSASSYDGYPLGIVKSGPPTIAADLKTNDQWSIFRDSGGGITLDYNNAGTISTVHFPSRETLIANRSYYVRTDGSDSNTGLVNSAGGAWLTLQHAMDVISAELDIGGFTIAVNIGAGTFAGLAIKSCVGGGTVSFRGASIATTIITDGPNDGVYNFGECVDAPNVCIGTLYGFSALTFQNHGVNNPVCVELWQTAEILVGYPNAIAFDCTFMAAGALCDIEAAGGIIVVNTVSITGGSGTIANAFICQGAPGSIISLSGGTVTGTLTATDAFAVAIAGSEIKSGTFTGASVTGKRFYCNTGGVITGSSVGALGANGFPGTIAGTVDDAVSSYDGNLLGGNIIGGFTVTPGNGGTVSSGTFTPAAANGNYQYYINGGAHAFGLPAADSAIDVLITNNSSAGAITFDAGYAGGTHGDSLTTTDTQKFIVSVRRINSVSAYIIKALQ